MQPVVNYHIVYLKFSIKAMYDLSNPPLPTLFCLSSHFYIKAMDQPGHVTRFLLYRHFSMCNPISIKIQIGNQSRNEGGVTGAGARDVSSPGAGSPSVNIEKKIF